MNCVKITIVARGKTESALNDAVRKAISSFEAGCVTGADTNDEGGYYFNVNSEVPRKDWPQ